MAKQTRPAGLGTNDVGFGSVAWSSPERIVASDDSTSFVDPGSLGSNYLKAQSFGFRVPSDAVITGIVVSVERRRASTGADIHDQRIRVVKADGFIGTVDKADLVTIWPTVDSVVNYGGDADLWGETWTASDVNSANFGAVVACSYEVGSATNAAVDHIELTVHYTQHGTPCIVRHVPVPPMITYPAIR
ncbi:MAG: hypothetical protein ACRDLD_02210 [Thermoleophilaceae bacterium]